MAGAVNSGGFLACGRFVTHVTGFAAHFGIDMAGQHLELGLSMLLVPCFFFLGSFVTGLLIHVPRVLGRRGSDTAVYALMSLCFALVWIGGVKGLFGMFFDGLQVGSDSLLIALLCFGSGLQNAIAAPNKGSVVRTTHLTGVTTDLAVGVAHAVSGASRLTNRELSSRNRTRAGIIGCFILGSVARAGLFFKVEYHGFALPTFFSCGFMVHAALRNRRMKKKMT
jgi:uncharacterized membrane protein YoaK (UPF0700 family)